MGPNGNPCNPMEPYSGSWNPMGPVRPCEKQWSPLEHLDPYGSLWSPVEPYEPMNQNGTLGGGGGGGRAEKKKGARKRARGGDQGEGRETGPELRFQEVSNNNNLVTNTGGYVDTSLSSP